MPTVTSGVSVFALAVVGAYIGGRIGPSPEPANLTVVVSCCGEQGDCSHPRVLVNKGELYGEEVALADRETSSSWLLWLVLGVLVFVINATVWWGCASEPSRAIPVGALPGIANIPSAPHPGGILGW